MSWKNKVRGIPLPKFKCTANLEKPNQCGSGIKKEIIEHIGEREYRYKSMHLQLTGLWQG